MKTLDTKNYKDIIPEKDQNMVYSLLLEIATMNRMTIGGVDEYNRPRVYIIYEDTHTEYSPERTDPCPDYYGRYMLFCEYYKNDVPYKTINISDYMTLQDLDNAIYILYSYIENNYQNTMI